MLERLLYSVRTNYYPLLIWILSYSFTFTDRLQNDSEESIQTIPTIGFNVEVLQYKNIKFQVRYITYSFVQYIYHHYYMGCFFHG